jgi:hypothetical protein
MFLIVPSQLSGDRAASFLDRSTHEIVPHKKTSGGSFSVIAKTAPGLFKS